MTSLKCNYANNPQILLYRETDAGAELKLKCKLEWPNRIYGESHYLLVTKQDSIQATTLPITLVTATMDTSASAPGLPHTQTVATKHMQQFTTLHR